MLNNGLGSRSLSMLCARGRCKNTAIPFKEFCPAHKGRREQLESSDGLVFVYACRCGEYIKFGKSMKPKIRQANLQAMNPYDIIWIGQIETESFVEKAIHKHLEKYNHRGEWFHVCDKVLSISSLIAEERTYDLRVAIGLN